MMEIDRPLPAWVDHPTAPCRWMALRLASMGRSGPGWVWLLPCAMVYPNPAPDLLFSEWTPKKALSELAGNLSKVYEARRSGADPIILSDSVASGSLKSGGGVEWRSLLTHDSRDPNVGDVDSAMRICHGLLGASLPWIMDPVAWVENASRGGWAASMEGLLAMERSKWEARELASVAAQGKPAHPSHRL